jgi:hypothetical protein
MMPVSSNYVETIWGTIAVASRGKPLNESKYTLALTLGTKNLLPTAQHRLSQIK